MRLIKTTVWDEINRFLPVLPPKQPIHSANEELAAKNKAVVEYGSDVPSMKRFQSTDYSMPKEKDGMRGSYAESVDFGRMFFDWKKSKSLQHLHSINNAMALAMMDALVSEKLADYEDVTLPAITDKHIDSYILYGMAAGTPTAAKPKKILETGRGVTLANLMASEQSKIGAYMSGDSAPHLDWPVLMGGLITKALLGGNAVYSLFPRLEQTRQLCYRKDSRNYIYFDIQDSLRFALTLFVFPQGKGRLTLNLPRGMEGKLAQQYFAAVQRSGRPFTGNPNQMTRHKQLLEIIIKNNKKMSLTILANDIGPNTELHVWSPRDDKHETIKLIDAPENTAALRAYSAQLRGASISFHSKIAIPKEISEHMCQGECNIEKIHIAAERLSDLAFPSSGIMTNQSFDANKPELAVLDADYLDAAATEKTKRGKFELSSIKGSPLTDENGISTTLGGSVQWMPDAEDDAHKAFESERAEQFTARVNGTKFLSNFVNTFLGNTGASESSVDMSAEDADAALRWKNSKLGVATFNTEANQKSMANRFLRTSRAFGKVLYTNNDGRKQVLDVEGSRPANRSAYLNTLRLTNALSKTAYGRDPDVGIKKRVYIGIMHDMAESLKSAGLPAHAADYMEKDDFTGILGPTILDEDFNSFIASIRFDSAEGSWVNSVHTLHITGNYVKESIRNKIQYNETPRPSGDPLLLWVSRHINTLTRDHEHWIGMLLPNVGSPARELSTYDLLKSPLCNFLSRAVRRLHEKIGGDYRKLLNKKQTYPRLRNVVPLYVAIAKYNKFNAATPNGVLDLEAAVDDENKLYQPGYGEDVVDEEVPNLPLMGKNTGFLPHSLQAEHHLKRKPKYAILDVDAGGGKTFMAFMDVLRFIKEENAKKILAICPGQLLAQYTEEAAKFTDGKLNVFPINMTEVYSKFFDRDTKQLLAAILDAPPNTLFALDSNMLQVQKTLESENPNVIKISYEGKTVERNVVVESLRQVPWDVIYVDESHKAKNPKASYYKNYARLLETARYVRLMSGTFVYNTVNNDLLGQARLLDPSIFGTDDQFESDFMDNASIGRTSESKQRMAMTRLASRVDLVQVRRSNWAQTLPDVTQKFHSVQLSSRQRQMYEMFVELISRFGGMEFINKMLQMDDSDAMTDDDGDDEPDDNYIRKLAKAAGDRLAGKFLQRTEMFLAAPGADKFFDDPNFEQEYRERLANAPNEDAREIIKAEKQIINNMRELWETFEASDKVSPKLRRLLHKTHGGLGGLIHEHFQDRAAGKVMIYTSYRVSARQTYEYLTSFPQYKNIVMHYQAEKQNDLIEEMQHNDKVKVVVGVEKSINTGFNFQMFSRLIRLEMVWTPGELEQGESRINRPDVAAYLRDEMRKTSYIDILSCDNTLDVTKSMKLIAKQAGNAKANNINTCYRQEDGPEYFGRWSLTNETVGWEFGPPGPGDINADCIYPFEEIPEPPPITMNADTIKMGHSFSRGIGADYRSIQGLFGKITRKEHARKRKLIASRYSKKSYPAKDAGTVPGAAIGEMPHISRGHLPFEKELGLLSISEKARKFGIQGKDLELEMLGENERNVTTHYGDGILVSLGKGACTVDINGIKQVGIPRASIRFISKPQKITEGTVKKTIAKKLKMKYVQSSGKDVGVRILGLTKQQRSGWANISQMSLRELRDIVVNLRLMSRDKADDAGTMELRNLLLDHDSELREYAVSREAEFQREDAEDRDDDFQEKLDALVVDLRQDTDWTKAELLKFTIEEMELLTATGAKMTRRSPWYKRLEAKGRKGIIDMLARDYPDEFVESFWADESEDTEDTEETEDEPTPDEPTPDEPTPDAPPDEPEETEDEPTPDEPEDPRFAEIVSDIMADKSWTKSLLLDDVLNWGLTTTTGAKMTRRSPWYKRLEAKGRKGILNALRNDYPKEFIDNFWVDDDAESETELASLPLTTLQINNLISISVGKEHLNKETAAKLKMQEVGPYIWFDVSSHRKMNAFMDKMLDIKDKRGGVTIAPRYWNPLVQFQELLNQYKSPSDKLALMDRAQKTDIKNFFLAKRTVNKNKKALEILPVVLRDRDGNRHLRVMAWEERQMPLTQKLLRVKTRIGGRWKKDDNGFWLKMFINKNEARSWINKVDRSSDMLAEMGYALDESARDAVVDALGEIKILRKKTVR